MDLRDVTTQGTSTSKATEADSAGRPSRSVTRIRRQFHPASLWWEDLGPTAAQCLPGPRDLNTIDHAVVIVADEVMGWRDITTHQGPVTRLDDPGTLTRRMLRGQAVLRGGQRRSGLLVLPLIISVITRGCRGIVGPCQVRSLDCPTCPDMRSSCPRSFHVLLRREPSQ